MMSWYCGLCNDRFTMIIGLVILLIAMRYIKSVAGHCILQILCIFVPVSEISKHICICWNEIRVVIFCWFDSGQWAAFVCRWPALACALRFYNSSWESVTSCCLGQYHSCIFLCIHSSCLSKQFSNRMALGSIYVWNAMMCSGCVLLSDRHLLNTVNWMTSWQLMMLPSV